MIATTGLPAGSKGAPHFMLHSFVSARVFALRLQ